MQEVVEDVINVGAKFQFAGSKRKQGLCVSVIENPKDVHQSSQEFRTTDVDGCNFTPPLILPLIISVLSLGSAVPHVLKQEKLL